MNHENIGKHPERISKMEPYIGQYEWKYNKFSHRIKRLEKILKKKTK